MIRCFSTEIEAKVGLRAACVFNQLHYWLCKEVGKQIGDSKWIWNSFEDWNDQFPNWGIATVKRSIRELRNTGLIFVSKFSLRKSDRTNWYTINYDNPLVKSAGYRKNRLALLQCKDPLDQNDPTIDQNDTQTPPVRTDLDQNDTIFTNSNRGTKKYSKNIPAKAGQQSDSSLGKATSNRCRLARRWYNQQTRAFRDRIVVFLDRSVRESPNLIRDERAYRNSLLIKLWQKSQGIDVDIGGFSFYHEQLAAMCL